MNSYDLNGRPLRVLFLGNDDNMNYQMARWSREFGVAADLWIIQPVDPYRGDIRLIDPDLTQTPSFVQNVPFDDARKIALFPGATGRRIGENYDFVSVCGTASLVSSLRLPVPRGLICTGAELGDVPFPFKPDYARSQGHRRLHYNLTLAALARAALKRLAFIVDSFEEHTLPMKRLGLLGKRKFIGFPADSHAARGRIRPELRKELLARYGSARRVFMWFSRLNFSDPNSLIYKGAERYLKALECVLPEIERGEIRLVMGRHGNEVDEFVALVDKSPLKEHIDWVPHLGTHELSTYLSLPNAVLFAECSEHLRELSGIGRDSAAMGTVTVSSAIPEIVERQYGRKAPMLRAVQTHEVAARMRELADMSDESFGELQRAMSEFGEQAVDYKAFIPEYYGFIQTAIAKAQYA
jgi:hypothetical protein